MYSPKGTLTCSISLAETLFVVNEALTRKWCVGEMVTAQAFLFFCWMGVGLRWINAKARKSKETFPKMLLLMEEIPNNHLGCIPKPANNGDFNYLPFPQLVFTPDFNHQQYENSGDQCKKHWLFRVHRGLYILYYPVMWTVSWKNAMSITVDFFHFVVLFVELPSTSRKKSQKGSIRDPPKKYPRWIIGLLPASGTRW